MQFSQSNKEKGVLLAAALLVTSSPQQYAVLMNYTVSQHNQLSVIYCIII